MPPGIDATAGVIPRQSGRLRTAEPTVGPRTT